MSPDHWSFCANLILAVSGFTCWSFLPGQPTVAIFCLWHKGLGTLWAFLALNTFVPFFLCYHDSFPSIGSEAGIGCCQSPIVKSNIICTPRHCSWIHIFRDDIRQLCHWECLTNCWFFLLSKSFIHSAFQDAVSHVEFLFLDIELCVLSRWEPALLERTQTFKPSRPLCWRLSILIYCCVVLCTVCNFSASRVCIYFYIESGEHARLGVNPCGMPSCLLMCPWRHLLLKICHLPHP